MNVAQKIIAIMGAFYVLIGGAISIVFLLAFWGTPGGLGFLAIPMLFVILGMAFIIGALIPEFKKTVLRSTEMHIKPRSMDMLRIHPIV